MAGVRFDQLSISEEMVTGANLVAAVVVVVAPERPVIDVLPPRLTWQTSGNVQN